MTTDEQTQYDIDENKFIDIAQKMLDDYSINLNDLIDILKDRTEDTNTNEEVEKKANEIMNNIMEDKNLCLVRNLLEEHFYKEVEK